MCKHPSFFPSMVGGVVTSTIMELLIYPAIFEVWKGWGLRQKAAAAQAQG